MNKTTEERRHDYPCTAHADWLQRLDNRIWTILLVAAGGAIASLFGLLVQLSHLPK